MNITAKKTALMTTAALAIALAAPVQAQQANTNTDVNAEASTQVEISPEAVVEYAGERAAVVILELQEAGYRVSDMSKTLLGRIKVTVQNEVHTRQIFISRATGEVKQDLIVEARTESTQSAEAESSETTEASADAQITIGGSVEVDGNGVSVGGDTGLGVSIDLGN